MDNDSGWKEEELLDYTMDPSVGEEIWALLAGGHASISLLASSLRFDRVTGLSSDVRLTVGEGTSFSAGPVTQSLLQEAGREINFPSFCANSVPFGEGFLHSYPHLSWEDTLPVRELWNLGQPGQRDALSPQQESSHEPMLFRDFPLAEHLALKITETLVS
jgi:hypothetical protein